MARRGRNYGGNQQNQNRNNNQGNSNQNNNRSNNRNDSRNNNGDNNGNNNNWQGNGQNNGNGYGNSNFKGNRGDGNNNNNGGNSRGGYQGKRRWNDNDNQDNNGNSRRRSNNSQQDDSKRPFKKQRSQDKEQDEYEKQASKNPLIATLRDRNDMLLRAHPNRQIDNLFATEADKQIITAPNPPRFGFEKDWKEDDFLAKFVANAIDLQAMSARILNLSEVEQYAILKFMFTSDGPIPVGNKKYSPSGAFQHSQWLNNLLQGQERLGKMIAWIFYKENVFYFMEVIELVKFVMITPAESLKLVRRIVLGSPVIRRAPGAREKSTSHRTQEDLDVERALSLMPGLEMLYVAMGYDINDQYVRMIMASDWCGGHPHVPDLEFARRVSHTLVNVGPINAAAVETDDVMFVAGVKLLLQEARKQKRAAMDTS